MLVEINKKDWKKSTYVCDMCKKQITNSEKNDLIVKKRIEYRVKTMETYHLCERCTSIIEKNIKIWSRRKLK